MSGLAHRGLKPVEELGASHEHGTRLRYLAGCKCFYCRRANSDYERERKAAREAGDWNGIVSATPARRHLKTLRKAGVGRRAVHQATATAPAPATATAPAPAIVLVVEKRMGDLKDSDKRHADR